MNAADTDKNEQYSYSRLEKHGKCSYKYWLHYAKPIPRPFTGSVATEAGTVAHTVLDWFAEPAALNRSMSTYDLLNHYWQQRLNNEGLGSAFNDLQSLALDYAHLSKRASAGYVGPDPIVDSYNKPYKKPKTTNAWRDAAAALNLSGRAQAIDDVAAAQPGLVWKDIPLSAVFGESYVFLKDYRDTMSYLTMYMLEMPISRDKAQNRINTVYFPGTDIEFTGFLDVIATDQNNRLYLIDHKSSKDVPDENKVVHWEQLILYGWALHAIWGVYPDYIGINHLRSNSLIIANFDASLVPGALRRALAKIKGIRAEVFVPQNPTDYGNACFNQYSTENSCEYLSFCHPRFAKAVGLYVPTWEGVTL